MRLLPILVLICIGRAQPVFEVASVKPAKDPGGVRGGCHGVDSKYAPNEVASAPPLGRCVIRDGRLSHMLSIAFKLRSMQLIQGGPDWVMMGDDRFNVEAKAEDPKATEEQLLQMLQALLIERFDVKLHRETRQVQGFAMIVAKNGPKLKDAKSDEVSATFSPTFKPAPGQTNTLTARAHSMPMFADLLAIWGKPVSDHTGLTGTYDFKLTWDDNAGPTLSTALTEQLGLKFEAQKVPVSYLIVESAKKPTEN